MDTITNELFELALNLGSSWKVTNVEFKPNQDGNRELHIDLELKDNQTFKCEVDECNEDCKIYDTSERTWRHLKWRHLNFFQYRTYIHAKLPRIKCSKHGIMTLNVPWARKESGFTLCELL
jgi:transposase